ncbi:MAG: helix-hairpin-helix domain-containing protein [Gaiellaceae bacterium]
MIRAGERRKMLAVHLCGPQVLVRLESIGVRGFADLRGRDPWDVMHEMNLQAGRIIWRAPTAVAALQNLIDAAEREARLRRRVHAC